MFVFYMQCALYSPYVCYDVQEESESQPVAKFSHVGGGGENLGKAIVLIGDKLVGKAIANRTCVTSEGVWGLAPRIKF